MFQTAIGACAVAWSERGIVGGSLPDRDEPTLRAAMERRYPGAADARPPANVQRAIDGIRALLRGERDDLAQVELDLRGVPEFQQRVYAIARGIAPGETLTYGDIATQLGDVTLARAVGQALAQNPFPPIVPCHRVLGADGRMHGFSAPGGVATKLRILKIEGWRSAELSLFE